MNRCTKCHANRFNSGWNFWVLVEVMNWLTDRLKSSCLESQQQRVCYSVWATWRTIKVLWDNYFGNKHCSRHILFLQREISRVERNKIPFTFFIRVVAENSNKLNKPIPQKESQDAYHNWDEPTFNQTQMVDWVWGSSQRPEKLEI